MNLSFKDFRMTEIIQLERRTPAERFTTIGLKCQMIETDEIEIIWIMPRVKDLSDIEEGKRSYWRGENILKTIVNSLFDEESIKTMAYEECLEFIRNKFADFEVY